MKEDQGGTSELSSIPYRTPALPGKLGSTTKAPQSGAVIGSTPQAGLLRSRPTLSPVIPAAKGTGKIYGYGPNSDRRNWRVRMRLKGKDVTGRACKTEEEARAEAVRLYNASYPESAVRLPGTPRLVSSPNAPKSGGEAEAAPVPNAAPSTSDATPQTTTASHLQQTTASHLQQAGNDSDAEEDDQQVAGEAAEPEQQQSAISEQKLLAPCLPHTRGGKLMHGYSYSKKGHWRVRMTVKGQKLHGSQCKTEEEARAEAIKVYNQANPEKPVSLPSAASRFPSPHASGVSREVKAESEPSNAAPAQQKKASGQWQGVYTIPPAIPGVRSAMRAYCYTKSASTGVGRWIVDLRQPVHHWLDAHTGQTRPEAKTLHHVVKDEAEAAETAMRIYCQKRRKKKSSAAHADAGGIDAVRHKKRKADRAQKGEGRRAKHLKASQLPGMNGLAAEASLGTSESVPQDAHHIDSELVETMWSPPACVIMEQRGSGNAYKGIPNIHKDALVGPQLDTGFDVLSALADAETYMKLPDEGKRSFIKDRVATAPGQDGLVAAKDLPPWTLLGEVCGIVVTQQEMLAEGSADTLMGPTWVLDQTLDTSLGWQVPLALDCSNRCNILSLLAPAASLDTANCVLLEYEATLTQRPHMLAFTFRAVPANEQLTQLNASPSCMRADAMLPRDPSQASLGASAPEFQVPNGAVHQARDTSPRDPRLHSNLHNLDQHFSTNNSQQISSHPASPEQTPFPSPHLPVPQAAAQQHANDTMAMHRLAEVAAGQAAMSNGPSGLANHDMGPLLTEPGFDAAALSKQMAELGDSLVEEASCAGLYESLAQAKQKQWLGISPVVDFQKVQAGTLWSTFGKAGKMAGRYPLPALIGMGLIVVNILAWFVMLGGASALQHSRSTVVGLLNTVNQLPGTPLAYGNLKPISTNQNFISYQWFKAVLEVLTLLGALAVVGMGMIHRGRVAVVGLLAVVTVFLADSVPGDPQEPPGPPQGEEGG
ncbi:hypothetical protein WJX73_008228 [Symbiochloris irregularis]|uniref:AP2/ERF domain-containing protein n=1 Tax=Symbiochloris irregularis TaxID=706552 RepID=A0AAW1P201_9CHLO